MAELPSVMSGRELDDFRARESRLGDHGVPADLAERVAVLASAYAVLGMVETGDRLGIDPVEVARVHYALGERLGLPALVERIFALPRDDRWQTMARAAVRDDLYGVHSAAHRAGAGVHQRPRPGPRAGRGVGGLRPGS